MRLFDRQGPYDVVQAICDATKHCGHSRPHNVPFDVGTDYERPPAVADLAVADLSIVGDTTGGREIRLKGEGIDIYWSVITLLKHFQFFSPELAGADASDL
jgi:hypothetical protein